MAHVADNGTLWFDLGGDGTRFQYLARGSRRTYGNGLDAWAVDRIDVLTTQSDAFRNAADIKVAVDQALRVAGTVLPQGGQVRLVFADNFDRGIVADNGDSLVYMIDANRSVSWRGDVVGEWRYNLQYAQNFLFRRDELAARKKRDELRQQAYRERDNLRQYDNLVEQARQNAGGMLANMQQSPRYTPVIGSEYAGMMEGRARPVRLVVHVDGDKDQDAVLDWPYDMRLVGQKNLKKGWYLVSGQTRLDTGRKDDDGLPLTLLTLDKNAPFACQKDGCADLNDPLVGARMMLGLPDWTPEKAREIIQQAEQP
ncbi:hypothetical protein CAL29_06470 [Bordetella genomosp. 10]|uniref:Uncharacterized protein n=1 Tax=Bordetella genomosp. 10 TaxID=1416804 RepID=A0A261SLX9_9BORD|nr:hypothetical protein CAL29_06470 [Bordetella genomosp. 10]